MSNFTAILPAMWVEKQLKNVTSVNSAELPRPRYFDAAATDHLGTAGYAGPHTHYVIPQGLARLGGQAHSFVDDFYNRLHMQPLSIDAGLIVSDVEYTVEFFNAWLTRDITFTGLTVGVPTGLSIALDLPYTLRKMTGREVTITFLEQGPPIQDTEIVFENDANDMTLVVLGRRLVDFYPMPSWGDGFEFTMSYATVVTRLGRQKEQRRPLTNYPMWQIANSFWDTGQTGRDISAMFKTGINRIVSLPVFTAGVDVLGVIDANTIKVRDISKNWWFLRQAQMVTLIDNRAKERQILSIAAIDVATGVITLAEELKLARPAEAYPCVQAYYTNAQARQVTSDILVWDATFKVYAYGAEPLRGLPQPPAVFPFALNFGQPPRQKPEIIRGVTYVPGSVEIITPLITYPYDELEASISLLSQADEFKFMDFFAGVKGRHKAFTLYNPSVMFETTRAAVAGATSVRVKGDKNNILNLKQPLRFYVQGPGLERPVITADALHPRDDGDCDMYLTAPSPVAIPRASLLGQAYTARLNSDSVVIKYAAPFKATVNLAFKEIDE